HADSERMRAALDQMNLATVLLVAKDATAMHFEHALELLLASRELLEQGLERGATTSLRRAYSICLVQVVAAWCRIGDPDAAFQTLDDHLQLQLSSPLEWIGRADAWSEWTRAATKFAASPEERERVWERGRNGALEAIEAAVRGGLDNPSAFMESDAIGIFADEERLQAVLRSFD
ncbi:MAG: hypothetical protein ACI841_004799, partial [Planctomycetota bacterium]